MNSSKRGPAYGFKLQSLDTVIVSCEEENLKEKPTFSLLAYQFSAAYKSTITLL